MDKLKVWNQLDKIQNIGINKLRGITPQNTLLPQHVSENAINVIFTEKEQELFFDKVNYDGVTVYKLRQSVIGGRKPPEQRHQVMII